MIVDAVSFAWPRRARGIASRQDEVWHRGHDSLDKRRLTRPRRGGHYKQGTLLCWPRTRHRALLDVLHLFTEFLQLRLRSDYEFADASTFTLRAERVYLTVHFL